MVFQVSEVGPTKHGEYLYARVNIPLETEEPIKAQKTVYLTIK